MADNSWDWVEESTTNVKKVSRRKRREYSKLCAVEFKPQYNGSGPLTFTEYIEGFTKAPNRLRKNPLNKTEVSE